MAIELEPTKTGAPDRNIRALVSKSHEVARILKALANPNRLLILCKLAASGECSVGTLASAVDLSQSALSQHLAKLREEGLVTFRRESQSLFYAIADAQLERLLIALEEIYCPELLPN